MGLILAAGASLSSVLGDQWKDYFYCSEMPTDVLVRKGQHHTGKSYERENYTHHRCV